MQSGSAVRVTTNSFEILKFPKEVWYHYDVIISEKNREMGTLRRHQIMDAIQVENAQKFTPRAPYDGRANLFSTKSDLAGTYIIYMGRQGRGRFDANIKLVQSISPDVLNAIVRGGPQARQNTMAINLLQIIVQQGPNKKHGFPPHAKAFFFREHRTKLSRGLEAWNGFFQSVRPVSGRLLINVDIANAAVYTPGPLLQLAASFLGIQELRGVVDVPPGSSQWKELSSFLRNVQVRIRVGRGDRPKKILGIVPEVGAYQFTKDDKVVTIQEHFRSRYQISLQYPRAFGVKTGKTTVYPAELCEVLGGQIYRKKLSPVDTAAFIRHAIKKPQERLQLIKNGVSGQGDQLGYSTSDFMINSGMQVATHPIEIAGHYLSTPTVVYGNNLTADFQPPGRWNVKNKRFLAPKNVRCWGLLSFVGTPDIQRAGQAFAQMLWANMEKLGVAFEQAQPILSLGNSAAVPESLNKILASAQSRTQRNPTFIVVILPESAAETRKAVKQWGDFDAKVPTQCIRVGKFDIQRNPDQYVNNVALKIHAKIGGVNSTIHSSILSQEKDVMFVGADVGHPGPGVLNRPSVTSLVASVDSHYTRYSSTAAIQPPRQEIIADLGEMMKTMLKEYFDFNAKKFPKTIVFFRDGVSEGEYEEVSQQEISQIDALFAELKLEGLMKPKLVFVVVGKRHHVRFFPVSTQDAERSGNFKPGLVVDKEITNPSLQDFYLQSHSGIQGTSRPAHYIILRNDPQWPTEKMQAIAYALCFVYASATSSVSIPAPVYYADRVCARADFHFAPGLNYAQSDTATVVSDGGHVEFDLDTWKRGFRQSGLGRFMYFL